MPMQLYHVTTSKAARSIEQTQFRPGNKGYAGAGIYFSADAQSAIRHCFNGLSGVIGKSAELVICCSVDLGRCLTAQKHEVDEQMCFAKGYDSVKIKGTDTYAVYDASRITVNHFRRLADDVCWHSSAATPKATPKATKKATPKATAKATAKATPKATAKATAKASAKATAKAKAKASAKTTAKATVQATLPTAFEIVAAAIQASPTGCLNVTSDISQLCLKHSGLQEALRAAGRLRGFCEAHPALTIEGQFLKMAQAKPLTVSQATLPTAFEIVAAAIQACPTGCLNVTSDISQLCVKHSGLQEAFRAAGRLRGFCEAHPALTIEGQFLKMAQAKPSTALETLIAAIQASPTGSLNVTSDISQLCLKHCGLQESLRAAGGLNGFCKAHPELTRLGSSVALSDYHTQQPEMLGKKDTKLAQGTNRPSELQKETIVHQRAAIKKQAKETRRQMLEQKGLQMLEQKEMQLKQEKTQKADLQEEGAARQSAPPREQAAETSREMLAKWKEAQKLHTMSLEKESSLRMQKMKWEKASLQRMQLIAFLLAAQ